MEQVYAVMCISYCGMGDHVLKLYKRRSDAEVYLANLLSEKDPDDYDFTYQIEVMDLNV